jgi:hypothetical protein
MMGWVMKVEHLVDGELARDAEVLGENLPRMPFVHHKSCMTWPTDILSLPQQEADN